MTYLTIKIITFVPFSGKAWLCFAFFISLFIADYCYGQHVSYNYEILGTEDGLASSEVYFVLEDRHGYLWFATDAGVSRYDGYEFTNYTVVDGLIDNTIFKLHEDKKGRIWFMGFRNGICYFQNDRIHPYKFNKQLTESIQDLGWISSMTIDSNDRIQFNLSPWGYGEIDEVGRVTLDGYKPRNTKIHRIVNPNGSFIDLICDFSSTSDRNLSIIDNGVKRLNKPLEANPFHVYSYSVDDEAYFFNLGTIIGYIDNDTILVKHLSVIPMTFNKDDKGRIWVAYLNKGVAIYNSVFELFEGKPPSVQLLDGFNVSRILNQPGSGMWLSLENRGACHIYNYDIENFFFDAVKPIGITALAKSDSNELFLSVPNGDFYKINAEGKFFPLINGYSNARDIQVDEQGKKIYVASFEFRNEPKNNSNGYEFNYIHGRGINILNDSSAWVLSPQSLNLKVNGKTTFKTAGYQFFKTIFKDDSGTIWLGGNEGFFKMENQELISCNELLGLKNKQVKVNKIRGLKNGTMMIATKNHGLLLLSASQSLVRLPFKDDVILDMYLDEDGELWVGTNNGIIRLKRNQIGQYSAQRINHLNGLSSNQINCINGLGDYIYAGTENGLARFNKREFSPVNLIPKISFKSISINGNSVILANSYDLHYDQKNIEFSFVGLSYDHSGKLKYRYRLKGAEDNWLYTENRIVSYSSLQPGNYEFQVSVSAASNIWSPASKISLVINMPWWRTSYFISFIFLVFILLILSIYIIRVRRKNRQHREARQIEAHKRKMIEAKLVALRAQMNPHFTFNTLAAIQDVMVRASVKEAMNYMTSFSVLIRKILERSENMYITVDEELEMLKLYIQLENLRLNNTIDCDFEVQADIDLDFTEIPSMVIQPFVENAIIHGLAPKKNGKRELKISFKSNSDELICVVSDSGIGRVRSQEIAAKSGFMQHRSLGIKITEERIKLYNSDQRENFSFKIIDCYNEKNEPSGTRVEITFKKMNYD